MIAAQEKFELGPIQKEWLRRLRAHPERQGTCRLGKIIDLESGNYKACCLGEAVLLLCELSGEKPETSDMGSLLDNNGGFYPDEATVDKLGIRGNRGRLKERAIVKNCLRYSLSEMNDDNVTWPEIADYIEANPENVFTKSA